MTAQVLPPAVAATVPIKPRHRLDRADFKRLAEYIADGVPSTLSTSSVIPQHLWALGVESGHFIGPDGRRGGRGGGLGQGLGDPAPVRADVCIATFGSIAFL
jgi:hypothetical protein